MNGIKDYARLHSLLKSVTVRDYKITTLNNDVWKINSPDSDTYRALTHKLDAESIQWHTYENKIERPIRVMALGLHASRAKEDIQDDLYKRGYKIIDPVNTLKKARK